MLSQKMDKGLDEISGIMSRAYGLDLSAYDEVFLSKSLAKRQEETGLKSASAYGAYLAGNRAEAEAFSRSITISFSEFFRNPLTFAVLEQLVLPALLEKKAGRAEIRLWSAGCAAGQEAYSLAILLAGLTAGRGKPLNYRIFATDNSEAALAEARAGVYDAAAVRNVRLEHIEKYFKAAGGSYKISREMKDRVDFSAYDLLDAGLACPPAAIYGEFDLVFCGNLLFYYRPEIRQAILKKICGCLATKGFLVTGEAEREIAAKHKSLRPVTGPAAVFQKI